MNVKLIPIPGVGPRDESVNNIRAFQVDGKSLVLSALAFWEARERAEYKSMMKVIKLVGGSARVLNEKHVRKGSVFTQTYEARAHAMRARLLFFYDGRCAIFTNAHWKPDRNQDTAFRHCESLRRLYFETKGLGNQSKP